MVFNNAGCPSPASPMTLISAIGSGLVPMPVGLPYTATKLAVVGLSLALRAEARAYGVRVSAVCPGFVDTPFLARPPGERRPLRMYTPKTLARDVLRGVGRNRALIIAPRSSRLMWRAVRLAPGAVNRAMGALVSRLS